MNKVVRDGLVGVVIAPGFGAGWSTWNAETPEIMFDPMIVACVENREFDKLSTYMNMRYPDVYLGALKDLTVKWIPQGSHFRIHEYDGSETIEIKDKLDWLIA